LPGADDFRGSLEILFARHLIAPARASFSATKHSRRKIKTLFDAQSPLYKLLEPLRDEISHAMPNVLKSQAIIRVIPLLFEEVIKLSPQATPHQRAAEVLWIESVFAALSFCAGEPIPFALADFPKAGAEWKISPMANMLQVVKEHGISLTSDFLESILVDYSGLLNLSERYAIREIPLHGISTAEQERKPEPHWRLISVLLSLDGDIFLTKQPVESTEQRTKYVDALTRCIAAEQLRVDVRFIEQVSVDKDPEEQPPYPFHILWDKRRKTMVKNILIPLMQAYAATRNLGEFISLWNRELRREGDWNRLGTSEERCLPWMAPEFRQAFWVLLEDSLTTAKINEYIVEYSLPIKGLIDEVANTANQTTDWSIFKAVAPASVNVVLLEILLQGIEKEETVPLNTMLLLTDLVSSYCTLDMSQFKCASRIWAILTRLHQMVFRIDPEEAFLRCPKPEILDIAVRVNTENARCKVDGPKYRSAFEAYRLITAVSSNMLTLPELRPKVEVMLKSLNIQLDKDLEEYKPQNMFSQHISDFQSVKVRFLNTMLVLVQYPLSLQ
jgi:hypothetical protein